MPKNMLKIKEQTFEDLVTGLTFQFVTAPDSPSTYRMYVFARERISRQILFDKDGKFTGIWTAAAKKPTEECCDNIVCLQEQVIEDDITGLTFSLDAVPESKATTYRVRITGNIPFGNRDIYFDKDGKLAGMGTSVMRAGRHVQVVK